MAKNKNNKNTSSGSGVVWGLLLGLIVGAILALLFAPQSGEETREQLSEQSIELRRRGFEGYQQLLTQVQERYGDAIAQAREAYPRTRDEVLSRYTRAKNFE